MPLIRSNFQQFESFFLESGQFLVRDLFKNIHVTLLHYLYLFGMIKQQTNQNKGEEARQTPFELLDKQVYPLLNQALHKLINHIVKTEQVAKHHQKLLEQRILDELEVRREEREKQRDQLGSDYDSSDDERYLSALQMKKEDVDVLLEKRKHSTNKKATIHGFNPIVYLVDQLKLLRDKKA